MEPSGGAHSQEGSLLARIGLAIGATLVFLLLLELGGRAIEWVFPPGDAILARSRDKRTEVPEAEPGTYRVFVYGGSTVAGAPTQELAFVAQLDFWLERLYPERPVEIVNFGVNGRPSGYVLAELERTLPYAPDLAIVLTAHNDFQRWKPDSGWEQLRFQMSVALEETAVVRSFRRIGQRLKGLRISKIDLRGPLWIEPEDREGERFRQRAAGYFANTEEIVRRTREAGVPLIFATGAANLSDWPPVWRFVHDETYTPAIQAVMDQLAAGEVGAAEAAVAKLASRYPSDAMLTYLQGRIAVARGDASAAVGLFDAARDADPIPWRVLSVFNEHVRRISRTDGVFLADVDLAFRREADEGLVGWELVADNCHPTPFGGAILARELLLAMSREQGLFRDLQGLPPLEAQWEIFREATLRERPELWLEYLLTDAVYVMKWPFYNFAASKAYLEQAEAIAPEDWRIPANRGTVLVLEGRVEEGRRELERAEQLFGEPLHDYDRGPTPYLREAMAILSGEMDAFAPPDPE